MWQRVVALGRDGMFAWQGHRSAKPSRPTLTYRPCDLLCAVWGAAAWWRSRWGRVVLAARPPCPPARAGTFEATQRLVQSALCSQECAHTHLSFIEWSSLIFASMSCFCCLTWSSDLRVSSNRCSSIQTSSDWARAAGTHCLTLRSRSSAASSSEINCQGYENYEDAYEYDDTTVEQGAMCLGVCLTGGCAEPESREIALDVAYVWDNRLFSSCVELI